MKKSTVSITLSNMLFILLLSVSGAISGVMSEVVYALSFLIPSAILLYISRGRGDKLSLSISAKGTLTTLTALPAVVGGIFLISYLTALLMAGFGFSNNVELSGDMWQLVLTSALIPALFEELLFRYATLSALGDMPNSKKVIISAFFFAFSHCSFFSIPYAFFAGIAFAALDIVTGSVLPSVILHFINNLISIFWVTGIADTQALPFVILLAALTFISLFLLIGLRHYFFGEGGMHFEKIKLEIPPADLILYAAVAIAVAAGMLLH
ncbi:MAG: CPBP family intramembrane metalloprotease [Clostridia bacterium]|nr:CPBP family intramembrane metalloprotease [Clostridia bacterium]MBQ8720134.1 CPBP family intramembrane metalloprotease [Clostridia bacterium]